jgi:hypothetical protein
MGIGSIPVSTNSQSRKFFAKGVDRGLRKLPDGQITGLDRPA